MTSREKGHGFFDDSTKVIKYKGGVSKKQFKIDFIYGRPLTESVIKTTVKVFLIFTNFIKVKRETH